MKIIILAGGSGTRLWPMSRSSKPKQFYELLSMNPMLKDTYERFTKDFNHEDIYISTNKNFVETIKKIFPEMPEKNLIVEPSKRDTAPAMGYAALLLSLVAPDEPIVFIPSDHYIADIPRFIESLKAAEEVILETGKMLDIAILPNFPSTIVGYTQVGELVEERNGVKFYQFLSHTEKPEYEIAKKYVESGNYFWHANYYMWTPKKFLEAYKEYAPEMYEVLEEMKPFVEKQEWETSNQLYEKMEKISIDYAITEKMDPTEVLIIKGDFGWSDIGAWDVLYDRMKLWADENNNLVKGNAICVDTHNSLVYGQSEKIIATVGLNDMIVVDTGDALLVCPMGRAQDVKKAVAELKARGQNNFL